VKQEPITWALVMVVVLIGNSILWGVVNSLFFVGGGMDGFRWPWPREEVALHLVLASVINGFFLGGMYRIACRQVRGMPIRVNQLFSVLDVLNELAMGSIACATAVCLATVICMVIPGLILHGLLMFTLPLIVDARLRAFEAMRLSWNALKTQWLSATLFHLVASFLSGLGFCFCLVGIVITGPLYVLAVTVLYRDYFPFKGSPYNAPHEKPQPFFDQDF